MANKKRTQGVENFRLLKLNCSIVNENVDPEILASSHRHKCCPQSETGEACDTKMSSDLCNERRWIWRCVCVSRCVCRCLLYNYMPVLGWTMKCDALYRKKTFHRVM